MILFFTAGGRERRKWRRPSLAGESEFVPGHNIYEVCEPSDSPQRKRDDSGTGGEKNHIIKSSCCDLNPYLN